MFQKIIKIVFSVVILFSLCIAQSGVDTCISFTSPAPGSIITIPSCTLMVQQKCNNIKSVEFQAQYFTPESDTPVVKFLGSISRKPYKFLWDISKIPNQYYTGVAFIAVATMSNNQKFAIKRDGVFFLHHPVLTKTGQSSYELPGTKKVSSNSIKIQSISGQKILSDMYWNEKEITVVLEVNNLKSFANISREQLSLMGLEVLIDPSSSRKPFPDKNTLIYVVPLTGKPYQIVYNPTIDRDGNYLLSSTSKPCDFSYSVLKEDFKGFSIQFSIPSSQFNGVIPDSLTCNIISRNLDINNEIIRSSWVTTHHSFEGYSPALWGTIFFQPKPLIKNRLLIFSSAFVVGLLIILVFALLFFISRKHHKTIKRILSESEQQQLDKIRTTFEDRVVQKDLTVEKLSKELKIKPSKLNARLKKLTGMSSQNYLMYCRVEIAKERLRSSHWKESAIAEASGFTNTSEMEKYFSRFNQITPAKFREQQQVA